MHSSQENRTCSPKEKRFVNEHFQVPTWPQSCIWKLRAYDASSGFGVKQNDPVPNSTWNQCEWVPDLSRPIIPFLYQHYLYAVISWTITLLPVTASFACMGPGACLGPPERSQVGGFKILILEQGAHTIILHPVPQIMNLVLLPQSYVQIRQIWTGDLEKKITSVPRKTSPWLQVTAVMFQVPVLAGGMEAAFQPPFPSLDRCSHTVPSFVRRPRLSYLRWYS